MEPDHAIEIVQSLVDGVDPYSGEQFPPDLPCQQIGTLRFYTWAPGIDHLLAMTTYGSTTNTYYALTDHLVTVHALADASGAIAESYEFDAWGNALAVYDASGSPIGNRQSAIGNRYLFQGREYSYATGLYHFRHRWYAPATGRWLSNAPIGISGGLNQYVFCANNPVNRIDPFGLADQSSPWGVGWEWLTGRGPRQHQFTQGDPFTTTLQQHGHIQGVRNTIANNLASGGPLAGRGDYSLSGLQGIPDFISDYSAVFTGGRIGNLAAAYLGSYNLEYNVLSSSDECGQRRAQVQFHVWNTSPIASGTRPPIIGYTQWYQRNVAGPLNNFFSSGPMSPARQDFTWTEWINY